MLNRRFAVWLKASNLHKQSTCWLIPDASACYISRLNCVRCKLKTMFIHTRWRKHHGSEVRLSHLDCHETRFNRSERQDWYQALPLGKSQTSHYRMRADFWRHLTIQQRVMIMVWTFYILVYMPCKISENCFVDFGHLQAAGTLARRPDCADTCTYLRAWN